MKKIIFLIGLLFNSLAFADPTIFNMQLGKTTENQLKKLYDVNHTGTNKYSQGNMYSIPVSSINFEGVKQVSTIFDKKGVLVAVLTTLPKSKFDYINNMLRKKYKRVNQTIPFVGDKLVTYRNGSTKITLDAPHMSFELSLNYIRNDFMKKYKKISQNEKNKQRKNEASQL